MGIDTGLLIQRINKPLPTEPDGFTQQGPRPATRSHLERETGIEPVSLAWKAKVLPLNYSRPGSQSSSSDHMVFEPRTSNSDLFRLVEEAGFEPAYA